MGIFNEEWVLSAVALRLGWGIGDSPEIRMTRVSVKYDQDSKIVKLLN